MEQMNAMLNDNSAKEGRLTKAIEKQTAKIPSVGFLTLAVGSIALSAALEFFGTKRREPGTFVGLWAPTFLLFGIYNKLVKLEGSDRFDRSHGRDEQNLAA